MEMNQDEMQEKLKNMNPEELAAFQKKNCIFCQIIEGKIPSKKIYEDDKVYAILDINPANPGHVLLLPKEHYSVMPQIPESEIGHMFTTAKLISQAMLKGLHAEGTTIFIANGVSAGQKAQHFMIHIIPRMKDDGVNINLPEKKLPDNIIEEIKSRIEPKIKESLGPSAPPSEKKEQKEEGEEKGEICVFCKLGDGNSRLKIYGDKESIAILTPNAASEGHIILFPKIHYPIMEIMPNESLDILARLSSRLSAILFEVMGSTGTNIIITNGITAGQKHAHFTINIIPRREGDGLSFEWAPKSLNEEEMGTIELTLKDFFGKPSSTPEVITEATPKEININTEEGQKNYLMDQLRRIP